MKYEIETPKHLERIELAVSRIKEISNDKLNSVYREYFLANAGFILSAENIRKKLERGEFDKLEIKELKAQQQILYYFLKIIKLQCTALPI